MKVQLVYPNRCQHPKEISLGLATISAVLKRAGHEVTLIDTTFGMSDREVVARVRRFEPDLIAASCLSGSFSLMRHLAGVIKEHFDIPLIVGGVHATVAPDDAISDPNIDMICVGEGEGTILELLDSMEAGRRRTDIPNIWCKADGEIIQNLPRPLVEDLDSLPGLDYDLFDYPRYLRHHAMAGVFITARGCPYPCTYCINHASMKLYKGLGKFVRYSSVDKAIAEMKRNVRKYGLQRIEIHDDTFTMNPPRVSEFCARYREELSVPFTVNARVENLTDKMCRELADGGCCRVLTGVETGNETIRREVMARYMSDEQIIDGCRMVKDAGMELYTFNVIGVPHESRADITMTIELNRKVRPDALAVSLFTAYPGTRLYQVCRENGWLDEGRSYHSYFVSTNVRHPHLSLRTLKLIRRFFGFRVFMKYDIKRALMELTDRNLINLPYYSRIRSLLLTKFIRRRQSATPTSAPETQ